MMYSGKPPPLRAFASGGTVISSSKDAAATSPAKGGLIQIQQQQMRAATSENCDPNHPQLHGKDGKDVMRKAAAQSSPTVLDSRNGIVMQLSEPAGLDIFDAAAGELDRSPQQQLKEVNRLPAAKSSSSSLPSPTKAAAPVSHHHSHSHGHSGRAPHFCRSPRCASNNPDYATPAQPPPRKYLISKRHLLPGAICTKDPAILASQTQQECFATPQPAPSTGKPPKPSRNVENPLRQPSFGNSASERHTPPPLAYETSPSRIPKPPFARSPAAGAPAGLIASIASSSPQDPASRVSGTETHVPELSSPKAEAQQQPVLRSFLEDEDISHERIDDLGENALPDRSCVNSDTSSVIAVAESISPRASSDAGESAEARASLSGSSQLDFPVISSGDDPVSLSTSPEERKTSPSSMELQEELGTDQCTPEPDGLISDSDSTLQTMPSSAELEDVTEKLAEKLAFANVEDITPPQVSVCEHREELSILFGGTESEEGSIIHHEQEDAEEHREQEDAEEHREQEDAEGHREQEDAEEFHVQEDAEEFHLQEDAEEKDGQEDLVEQLSSSSERGLQFPEGWVATDCQALKNAEAEDHQYETNSNGEFQNQMNGFDSSLSSEGTGEGQEEVPRGRSVDSYIKELESAQKCPLSEGQREVPKYVRGKGRQLWRSDCRDSREVVFLKQTPQADRHGEDWMVDNILEGAISRLNPSGQGRVRVLVEAFESLLNRGGQPETVERRASRVWCLNRMEKGEVDEDGEEFEEGDQRVDCYEVSGDGLQLRASMRLSLGGGNRLPLCDPEEVDEIEMSAIQKVQDWDDDCRLSQSFEDLENGSLGSHSQPDAGVPHDQENLNKGHSEVSGLTFGNSQRRISFLETRTVQNDNDRSSEDFSYDARSNSQFGCYTRRDLRADTRSTFSLDQGYKHKVPRRRRYWKANPVSLEPGHSSNGGPGKDQRVIKGTSLEPFNLRTEERGVMKEYQFAQKLEHIFAEEERLRNPIAQGLPWTTDEPEIVPKPLVKGQTRPVEFRHYSNSRAIERAEFDSYMSGRALYMEMEKKEAERLRQLAEQDEIKRLRREMVPRAQLMPFFDQPFIPTRSSKRLTVPKEPSFSNTQHKRAKCIVWQQQQQQQNQQQPWTYE